MGGVPAIRGLNRAEGEAKGDVGGPGHDAQTPGRPSRAHDEGEREPDGEDGQGDDEEVGVGVGEEEGEEGELGDAVVALGAEHAAAAPEVEGAEVLVAEDAAEALQELGRTVEVAEHGDKEGGQRAGEDRGGEAGATVLVEAAFDERGEVVDDGEGGGGGQGEEERDDESDRDGGEDAGELGEGGAHEEAEVVVVELAAGEPGVVGRHVRRLQDGVEVGEVHGLFAAEVEVPEVGVPHADGEHASEGDEEEDLAGDDDATVFAQELEDFAALAPEDEGRDGRQQEESDADGEAGEGEPVEAGE